MEYEIAPKEIKVSEATLYQLKREKDICLCEIRTNAGSFRSFEIHKLRFQSYSERKMGDRLIIYKAKERYCNNEEFGTFAVCCTTLEKAERHFQDMVSRSSWKNWESGFKTP